MQLSLVLCVGCHAGAGCATAWRFDHRGDLLSWLCAGPGSVGLLVVLVIILPGSGVAHLLLGCRLLNHPVEDEVILVAHPVEQVLKQLPQVANIRLLLELERAAVVEVDAELIGQVLGERLNGRG